MFLVACSGFPIPVSRYWREFPAVEIADTELGLPGAGTTRRWVREAPKGYSFSVLAPKVFADRGFDKATDLKALAKDLGDLAGTLSARAVVFAADEAFKNTKPNRTALKAFVDGLPPKMPQVVLDLRAWKTAQIKDLGAKRPVIVAYDPFRDEPPRDGPIAYIRLLGPAGHRSRYDDVSIDKLLEHCREAATWADTVLVVFGNIDMHANAQQLMKKLDALK
jgi:uncharacterized protein YecE (DUF72 family)